MAVNTTHPDYDGAALEWAWARDVLAGEDAVEAGGEKYLARLDSQSDEEFTALRPRMRGVVGPLEPFGGQVGIDLGRDQVRVAEQFLHAAQVRARVEQVRRVAVPQLVRRQVRVQTGDGEVFLQAQLQVPRRDRASASLRRPGRPATRRPAPAAAGSSSS